jgi:hypothetical protein
MQTMPQNVPLPTQTIIRLPKIKQGLREGLNYQKIADLCNVKSEKTIDRDMQAWVQSGDFEIWLKTEFVILHSHAVVADPIEAYKEIAKIVAKMVTQKREVLIDESVTETHNYNLNYSEEDKNAILAARRAILNQRGSQNRPESLH